MYLGDKIESFDYKRWANVIPIKEKTTEELYICDRTDLLFFREEENTDVTRLTTTFTKNGDMQLYFQDCRPTMAACSRILVASVYFDSNANVELYRATIGSRYVFINRDCHNQAAYSASTVQECGSL